jgi:cell division transport system ATP-binding protein
MQLLYRINRTGTTVVVATHDSTMVDRMRRRVIELQRGRIVRDENSGFYAQRDVNTAEFGALLSRPGQPEQPQRSPGAGGKPAVDPFDEIFAD